MFDKNTGKGYLSTRIANYPTFGHCHPHFGGVEIAVTAEFIAECEAAQPKSGDRFGGGAGIIA